MGPAEMTNKEIVDLLIERIKKSGPKDAIVWQDRIISYDELGQRSDKVRDLLTSAGVANGSIVALLIENTVELVAAIIGVLKANCVFAPLDTKYPANRLKAMVSAAEPQGFIVEKGFEEAAEQIAANNRSDCSIIVIEAGQAVHVRKVPRCASLPVEDSELSNDNPKDLGYIYFTSGSTGRPKGIAGSRRGLLHFIDWEIETFGVNENFRVSQLTPPSFDPFLRDIFLPLCAGATLCLPAVRETALDSEKLVRWIDVAGINLMHCTPSLFRSILNEPLSPDCFQSLKYVLLAGEQIFPADLKKWYSVFDDRIQLVNLYGPTETTLAKFCYFIHPSDQDRRLIPVGRPIRGSKALVLSDKMEICPPGVAGEIYIRTPYRSHGYYRQPERTREAFVRNPFNGNDPQDLIYRTGDIGRVTFNGDFELVGRLDNQVKIRGVRVELGEIEKLLRDHEDISEAAVKAWDDSDQQKFLCAYIVSEKDLDIPELQRYLSQWLPQAMTPTSFIKLDELPLNLNGKIDRQALPDPRRKVKIQSDYVAPRNPIERKITEIWQDILKAPQIGIHDRFFSLGAHSLMVIRAAARMRKEFQVEVSLRLLFEYATAATLAERISIEIEQRNKQSKTPVIARADRTGDLPLSYAQQRLWFLNALESAGALYNVPTGVRIKGEINVEIFEKCLNEIVRRHEVLRTGFKSADGNPFAAPFPAMRVNVSVTDISVLKENREAAVRKLAEDEAARPFDLGEPPLFRASLYQLNPQEYIAVLVMHHIISDGWSAEILVRELLTLYADLSKENTSSLAELPIQYVDFALWQRQWLQSGGLTSQLDYWTNRLKDSPGVLDLPFDHVRPPIQTFQGDCLPIALSRDLSEAVKQIGQNEGITLFATLLTAFQILLYRYTGQKDISVGSAVANRNLPETEGLIGLFVNTLVLRSDLSGNPTFRQLLGRVSEMVVESLAHQDLPFEKMVEAINPRRDLRHSPLFQVMFALYNTSISMLSLPGLTFFPYELDTKTSKFDLTLAFEENEQGLTGFVEYNTNLFESATIKRMVGHLETILTAVASDPDRRISNLPILTQAEKLEVLSQGNDSSRNNLRDLCLHQLIELQVERTPDATACVYQDRYMTYRRLNESANQFAHHLIKLGVGPESIVGVCLGRSIELVIALLGILKAGGTYLPLDPGHPKDRLSWILKDAGATVVVTQAELGSDLSTAEAHILTMDEWNVIGLEDTTNPTCLVDPDNSAYVIYTSGTTGRPKGVMIIHGGLSNYLKWASEAYRIEEGEGAPVNSSIGFDLTVTSLYGPLVNGKRVDLLSEEEGIEALARRLRSERGYSLVKITPAHLELLARQLESTDVEGIAKALVIGGEELKTEELKFWRERAPGTRLINEYGPTETVVGCCVYEINGDERGRKAAPIGRPIANTQMYLLDCELELAPVGVRGEIYISGSGVGRGYVRNPDLTADKFRPNPFASDPGARLYQTGDLARLLPDGNLEFLGRLDNQVKIRGFRIELGEIEAVLANHPMVRQAAVTTLEDGTGEKRLAAYIMTESGSVPNSTDLRGFLLETLPDYMIPSSFINMESFPLTSNGKIARHMLPTVGGATAENEAVFVAPRDVLELRLARIWEEILGKAPIGANDDFFNLGGHSLLAMRLLDEIRRQFGKALPVTALFQRSTVGSLAGLLRSELPPQTKEAMRDWNPLVEIQRGNSDGLPFYCVHPGGGDVMPYFDLARLLGPEQTFYGFQAAGLGRDDEPDTTIEAMATRYLQAMRAIQPVGPYLLGGWSLGGVVAFEMAQQLRKSGEEVGLLALIDSGVPVPDNEDLEFDETDLLIGVFSEDLSLSYEHLSRLGSDERLMFVINEGIKARILPPGMEITQARRYLEVAKKNMAARRKYNPTIYHGEITIFTADDGHEANPGYSTLGWDKYASAQITRRWIPGNHITILREPNVRVLADALKMSIVAATAVPV